MEKSKSVADAGTIHDVDLSDVVAFARVVEAGSFTGASRVANLPKSALSRRVARLEEALGVRLLQRTTRTLSLTDAGSAYYERASSGLAQLKEARDLAAEQTQEPAGIVRITCPVDIGEGPLTALLTEFVRRYPKIHVEVDATPRLVDLVGEGYDLAIRAGRLRDSSLVARKVGETPTVLLASPEYLTRRGRPKKLADLAKHDCVLFRSSKGESTWKLIGPKGEESVSVRGPLSGSDFAFIRSVAQKGAGIALLPVPSAMQDIHTGVLEWILPKYRGPANPVHLVYPSARFVPQRVAVLRDFLADHLVIRCPDGSRCNATVEELAERQTSGAKRVSNHGPSLGNHRS